MARLIAHRGPDDTQYFDDGTLSLVFCRLAVVATHTGQQPIFSQDKNALLVANSEIYNHRELRSSYSNQPFSTESDCEVALHGFLQQGTSSFKHLRGMFAMAFWDRNSKVLTLVRDRFGIKPLYICKLPTGLLFASELKALRAHPAYPGTPNFAPLHLDPLGFSTTPTYISGVEFLPAGSFLQVTPGGKYNLGHYWELTPSLGTAPYGEDAPAYIDALGELIEAATIEHLQSDGPLALHLSGGLDSTMLAAIAGKHRPDLRCYTIVERTNYLAGDVKSAQHAASSLGLPWEPILFDYRKIQRQLNFDLERLEQAVWMMDSPRFDLEWIFKGELNRCIRHQHKDIKVVLLGQGADEFSGGYSARIDAPRATWNKYLSDEINQMLHAHLPQTPSYSNAQNIGPYHQAMLLFLRQLQHYNLWHEDRSSSWHSLEARVPFLDHRIVELLASIPTSLHSDLFLNKQIMRHCMKRFFPSFDVGHPKIGFLDTTDTRSTDIIVHGFAIKVVAPFIEKYLSWPDCPLDKKNFLNLAKSVVRRSPGFYSDAYHLMRLMAQVIFAYQNTNWRGQTTSLLQVSLLELPHIGVAEWPQVNHAFSMQPLTPRKWVLSDVLELPKNTTISTRQGEAGFIRIVLEEGNQVVAELEANRMPAWTVSFINHLGRDICTYFSIQDWLDEYDISIHEFRSVLDMLYQAGMVICAEGCSLTESHLVLGRINKHIFDI